MPTVPAPVVHEPRFPTDEDIDRVGEMFGKALGEVEEVAFRVKAALEPYVERGEGVQVTYADLGRLAVFVQHVELDYEMLGKELRGLKGDVDRVSAVRDEFGLVTEDA